MDLSGEFNPDVTGDIQKTDFAENSFELVIIDPPYGPQHAEIYGVPMLSYKKTLAEMRRILIPGGIVVWLDNKYPAYSRKSWKLIGIIGVVTGFLRMARFATFFENVKHD